MNWKKELAREVKNSCLSLSEFARQTGIARGHLCNLINAPMVLTIETAIKLEKLTERNSREWLIMQLEEELEIEYKRIEEEEEEECNEN